MVGLKVRLNLGEALIYKWLEKLNAWIFRFFTKNEFKGGDILFAKNADGQTVATGNTQISLDISALGYCVKNIKLLSAGMSEIGFLASKRTVP